MTAAPILGRLGRGRVWQWSAAFAYAFCLFAFNVGSCATPAWFHDHQTVSDDLVWARMLAPPSATSAPPYLVVPKLAAHCCIDLAAIRPHTLFPASAYEAAWLYAPACISGALATPYTSQIGVQGPAVQGCFEWITASLRRAHAEGRADTVLAYGLMLTRAWQSALSAAMVACILLWMALEFGAGAYVAGLLSLPVSPWLTVFAHSVYWQLWLLLAPFTVSAFLCRARAASPSPRRFAYTGLWWLVVPLLCALRAAMGYEYASTVALSCLTPQIYYDRKQGRSPWHSGFESAWVMALAAGAGGAVIFLHATSLGHGDFATGLHAVFERAAARTYPEVWSALVAVPEVSSGGAPPSQASWPAVLLRYGLGFRTYNGMFMPFAALLGLFFWAARQATPARRGPYFAALAVAVAAPVSWYVIAKAHSAAHPHLNFLLWHLPTTWLGWALVGQALEARLRGPSGDRPAADL